MGPKTRSYTLHASGLQVAAANILKQEMLAIGGEAAIARGTVNCSVEKSDAIMHATLKQYHQLVGKLGQQPFGLKELAEGIEGALEAAENGPVPFKTGALTIPSPHPLIMGILNVTPDSFSDGGQYIDRERAVEHARRMMEKGADMVDIGGESTRPFSEGVSASEEWERVGPVIAQLADECPLSVDTCKGEVARRALEAGAVMINNVTAGSDPVLLKAVTEQDAALVLMHMKGTPRDMQENPEYEDVVREVCQFLQERVERAKEAGVRKIILDPGIGFGKTMEHNLTLLRGLDSIRSLGYPVLVGASRKSFIGEVLDLGVEERSEGSLAALSIAVAKGVDILRVHDVRESYRAAMMAAAIRDEHT